MYYRSRQHLEESIRRQERLGNFILGSIVAAIVLVTVAAFFPGITAIGPLAIGGALWWQDRRDGAGR